MHTPHCVWCGILINAHQYSLALPYLGKRWKSLNLYTLMKLTQQSPRWLLSSMKASWHGMRSPKRNNVGTYICSAHTHIFKIVEKPFRSSVSHPCTIDFLHRIPILSPSLSLPLSLSLSFPTTYMQLMRRKNSIITIYGTSQALHIIASLSLYIHLHTITITVPSPDT